MTAARPTWEACLACGMTAKEAAAARGTSRQAAGQWARRRGLHWRPSPTPWGCPDRSSVVISPEGRARIAEAQALAAIAREQAIMAAFDDEGAVVFAEARDAGAGIALAKRIALAGMERRQRYRRAS